MARFSLHAVGHDRPGIVAGVAEAIASMGWNVEASTMTLLYGQFAIVLVLDAPSVSDGRAIEAALGEVTEELDLYVAVRPVAELPLHQQSDKTITVSFSGEDRAGLVARISRELASADADICELMSHRVEHDDSRGCVLRVVAVLPPGSDGAALETRLRALADELEMQASIVTTANSAQ